MTANITEQSEIDKAAQRYTAEGYDIQFDPSNDMVPGELAGYLPNFIATRGEQHVLVEVRSDISSPERVSLVSVAERVRQLPGWRLDLVVSGPSRKKEYKPNLLSQHDQERRIAAADTVATQSQDYSGALLLLWTALESTLRRIVAEKHEKNISEPFRLLKESYSLGLLTKKQLADLQRLAEMRNLVAHGESPGSITARNYQHARDVVTTVLSRIREDE
ncbi:MAG: hypothetical protein WD065_15640 [Planctomycetaceae bacterium]